MSNAQVVIKSGKSEKIVIEYQADPFSMDDVNEYKIKFEELKIGKKFSECQFGDITWCLMREEGGKVNLPFTSLHKFHVARSALKCYAIRLIEQGVSSHHVGRIIRCIRDVVSRTHNFSEESVNDFEDYVYELRESPANDIKSVLPKFLEFYETEYADDYLDIAERIHRGPNNVRNIPDYASILTFHEAIHRIVLGKVDDKEVLKYYPVFLWWRITAIVPLRPCEFLSLEWDCCYKDDDRYWIKLPRKKIKQPSGYRGIERVDIIETDKDIYEFINDYKSMIVPENQSTYLISWKSYNKLYPNSEAYAKHKINPEKMTVREINHLLQGFYRYYISDTDVIPLRAGDSRHYAFCNLILQGSNPIRIARLGGHTKLSSQTHYYHHLEVFAESYVATKASKLALEDQMTFRNSSGTYDTIRRINLLETFDGSDLAGMLEIEKGYCTIKKKGCTEFSSCESDCHECLHHILNAKKYPDVLYELHTKSNRLNNVIREQVAFIKAISTRMYIDYYTETCSFEGTARLKETSELLNTTLAKKILIDAKLINYLKEAS
jgi:hypothetical protein